MKTRFNRLAFTLLFLSLSSQAGEGGIRLGQTRVIFSSADKAQTITLSNSSQRAYLIQSRVQKGPEDTAAAPFITTPPLFSLKGKSSQILRILPQNSALPADRESLFYLSVSAIPARTEPVMSEDRVSVGVRFLLKLFYRPQGLPEADACSLTFSKDAQGLRIANPGAYYHTLGALSINGRSVPLDQQPVMVAPESSFSLAVDGPLRNIVWQTITDHGGLSPRCEQKSSVAGETSP